MALCHFEVAAFVISRTAVQAHDQHQSEKHRRSTFCYVWPICTKNKSAILIVKEIFCVILFQNIAHIAYAKTMKQRLRLSCGNISIVDLHTFAWIDNAYKEAAKVHELSL